ncbi:hypothetical protein Q6D67_12180 [Haliea sp. E1-2-M8]|uniref:hypothetical protein n=1 Tax=Haliea sp. E1-2-M8 TaxID=3064706 RepID=UPI00271FE319|nr:hypothetical protein [Haliea sp. E1-2-M8]MDO8862459.1 hypothetical protein [Haliea sp. E1-2-M8]
MTKRKLSEFDTPTHKRIVGPLHEWFSAEDDRDWLIAGDADGTEVNFKAIEDLLEHCSQIVPSEETKAFSAELFEGALRVARMLAQRDDKTRGMVELIIHNMALGAAYLIEDVALLQTEAEQRNNILVNNAGKTAAKHYALGRARLHLKDDEGQKLRMGALADQVYRDLVGTEHEAYLPGTPDGVRKWLADGDLPEYVRSRGRPKKNR